MNKNGGFMRKRFCFIVFLIVIFIVLLVTGCNVVQDASYSDKTLKNDGSILLNPAMPNYSKVLIRNKWNTPRNVTEYLRCYPDPYNNLRNTIGCVPYNANERDYYVWTMAELSAGVAFQNVATNCCLLDSESEIMTMPPVKYWHVPLGISWQVISISSYKFKYFWKIIPTSDGYNRLKIADTNYYLNTEIQYYSNFIKQTYLSENAPEDWWSAQWAFEIVE
jgi:hypothetical protein